MQFSKTSPLKSGESSESPVEKVASNPVPSVAVMAFFGPVHFSISQGAAKGGVIKGGVDKRKRTQPNVHKRKQTQISGSLKRDLKRRQTRTNTSDANKRKSKHYTPPSS